MTVQVRLEPRVDPNEVLQEGLLERPSITFRSSDELSELVIGRGLLTGIADPSIGTDMFSLQFDESSSSECRVRATLLANPQGLSPVHVNGIAWDGSLQREMDLSSGDNVALNGLQYEYKLHVEIITPPHQPNCSDMSGTTLPSINTSQTQSSDVAESTSKKRPDPAGAVLSKRSVERISENIQCPVCLDIQVHPRTLHPCGHSFCAFCLVKLRQCPQCRQSIESHVPGRELDGLIATLVEIPNLLDKSDVENYRIRKDKTPRVQTAASVQPATKRLRPGPNIRPIHRYMPPQFGVGPAQPVRGAVFEPPTIPPPVLQPNVLSRMIPPPHAVAPFAPFSSEDLDWLTDDSLSDTTLGISAAGLPGIQPSQNGTSREDAIILD